MRSEPESTELGKCLHFIIDHRGKTPKKLGSDWVEQGVPTVSAKNVNGGRLVAQDSIRYVTDDVYKRWMNTGDVQRGDCLLVSEGATLGECMYWDKDYPIVLGQRLFCMRANPEVLYPRYLYFYMTSHSFQSEVIARSTGTSVPGLRQTEVLKLQIQLLPIKEQRIIGDTLYSLNNKIERNRQMNETLEATARALFKSWFVDFDPVRAKMNGQKPLGMDEQTATLFPDGFEHTQDGDLIPRGWMKTTLGDEVAFQTGFAFKSKFFTEKPPGFRLARGMNVKEGEFFWGSQARYWPEVTPDIEEYLLQAGDVLIGMDGSKVGRNWVRVRAADLPCLLVQRVARLRAASSVGENFIWILVGSSTFRYFVDAVKTGTSIPHISGGQIKSYGFVRPPRGDHRLFDHFESLMAPVTQQADRNHAVTKTLAAIRDTLLPKLLSGEIRVSDAVAEVDLST